jgi:hypothetical protein
MGNLKIEKLDQKWGQEVWDKIQADKDFRRKKEQQRQKGSDMPDILYYAGVGSRVTPDYILELMTQLAERLREDRMVLRSGHAIGADQAFEKGATNCAEIYLPWPTFEQDNAFYAARDENGKVWEPTIFDEPTQQGRNVAAGFHPNWDRLTAGAKQLHARNSHQILGLRPQSHPVPVQFVICWTADGEASGGTGQAIRIAEAHNIPVYNLAREEDYDMAFEWAWGD